MKENPEDPRTVLNNDCLAPEGYGEIIGGSQREDDYDKLLARIHEQGLDPEAYRWYLDLRRYGTFVHSGFGLGIERTVAWICGIQHIREAIAFPRQIHRLHPEGPLPHPDAPCPSPRPTVHPALPACGIQIDPALGAEGLEGFEAVPELAIGPVERRPRLNAGLAARLTTANRRSPISSVSRSAGAPPDSSSRSTSATSSRLSPAGRRHLASRTPPKRPAPAVGTP